MTGKIGQERLFAQLCGSLAGLALGLSCLGLYGLMAYHVTRRRAEIGVRMAPGRHRHSDRSAYSQRGLDFDADRGGDRIPRRLRCWTSDS